MDDGNKAPSCGGCKCILKFAWQCVRFWTPLSVTFVILWLLYRPDRFHPRVDSGVLAALHLAAPLASGNNATDHQLLYDLAVDLSFRNAHRRLSIRYLDIAATAFYGGTKLGPADDALPSPFLQGPKNTTVLHPSFRGAVEVDSGTAVELEREIAEGTVRVKVNVALTLKYKVWFVADVYFYKYDCWLWFPPPRRPSSLPAPSAGPSSRRAITCWDLGVDVNANRRYDY